MLTFMHVVCMTTLHHIFTALICTLDKVIPILMMMTQSHYLTRTTGMPAMDQQQLCIESVHLEHSSISNWICRHLRKCRGRKARYMCTCIIIECNDRHGVTSLVYSRQPLNCNQHLLFLHTEYGGCHSGCPIVCAHEHSHLK